MTTGYEFKVRILGITSEVTKSHPKDDDDIEFSMG